jgi:hypothetical protein
MLSAVSYQSDVHKEKCTPKACLRRTYRAGSAVARVAVALAGAGVAGAMEDGQLTFSSSCMVAIRVFPALEHSQHDSKLPALRLVWWVGVRRTRET